MFIVTIFFTSCIVRTRVSSVSIKPVMNKSFCVLTGDDSIESIKIQRMIQDNLKKRGFISADLQESDIIITFSAAMLGSKSVVSTSHTPIRSNVYNPITKTTSSQITGYRSESYSTDYHLREIRIQFHDGNLYREQRENSIIWTGVGKSKGKTSDIIAVAPEIVESILDYLNQEVDSKRVIKRW